jgi:hypothetical protein
MEFEITNRIKEEEKETKRKKNDKKNYKITPKA